MKNVLFDYRGIGHIEFSVTLPEKERVPSLFKCIVVFIAKAIYYAFIKRDKKDLPPASELLFVTQSINNQRTLTPITNYIKKRKWHIISIYDFPPSLVYRHSFSSFSSLIKFYNGCNKEEKYRIRRVFDDFAIAQGFYKFLIWYLSQSNQLSAIIVANDHTIPTRCLIEAARERGIDVIYTQHASVTDKFPPLHFSYSFLDGMESYEKYQKIGDIQGRIVLLGSPRFDDIVHKRVVRNSGEVDAIGVGLNPADSLNKVLQLCLYLKNKTGKKVIVRPHPRTMLTFDTSFFYKYDISISDSSIESSYDFFTKISVLIANESGIHLDAAVFGIPSIVFNFSDNPIRDWYGYIGRGLTPLARNENDVANFIESHFLVEDAIVQYYYAAFHTRFDGIIAKTIAGFLDASNNESNAFDYLNSNFRETSSGVFVI